MSHGIEEYYAVYDERFPRARKPHQCDACAEWIAVGQNYARVGIVFDGRASTVLRCMRCQRIHEHLRGLEREMWPDERLACGSDYADEWGEEPPPEIAALAFALPGDAALTPPPSQPPPADEPAKPER